MNRITNLLPRFLAPQPSKEAEVLAAPVIPETRPQELAQQAARRILERCSIVPPEQMANMHAFTADAVDFIFGVAASHIKHDNRSEDLDDSVVRVPSMRTLLETEAMSPIDKTAQLVLSILSEKRQTNFSTRNAELDNDYSLKVFPLAMAIGRYSVPVEVLRLETHETGDTTYIIQERPLEADPSA